MKTNPFIYLCAFLALTLSVTAQYPVNLYKQNLPNNKTAANSYPNFLRPNFKQSPSSEKTLLNCADFSDSLAPQAVPCNGVSVTSIVFNASARTVFSGTDNTVGVIYRYSNAGTAPDGTVLDALVTVQSYSNNQDTNLTNFSSADVPGATAGFEQNLQPNINQESGTFANNGFWQGAITYRIQFVVTNTITPKRITVAAISIDNDGGAVCGSSLRESVSYSTALNQVLTQTTSTQTVAGNTIQGPTTNQANIGVGPEYANAALYINVTEINWSYSFTTPTTAACTAGNASAARYGSLNMDCQITFDRTFAAVSLAGNVFNDANGLTDSTVNGTGTGTPGGTQVYANLVDTNGFVVSSVAVAANGTYIFPAVVAGSYTVQLSTVQGVESSTAPATTLPAGWVNTGENLGAGAGNDGTVNGQLAVTVATANITNANFGIEQRPVPANNTAASQLNPGGTTSVAVPATTFTATDGTPGTVTNIRITAFPTNATSITINGTLYTSGTFPVGGVIVPTNASGNPTQAILVDPVNGAVTVGIPYRAIDNAGVVSLTSATASVPFTVPTTAANALISGRLSNGETSLGGELVVLLNTRNNEKRFVRTDANGVFSFEEQVGNNYVIQPLSNKYSFSPSTKFVNLLENSLDENFFGETKTYRAKNDFDGDGKADVAVYREGVWYIRFSSNGAYEVRSFGLASDKPSVADFNGDGRAEISVYRPSEMNWYVLNIQDNTWQVHRFGLADDVQIAADYDGDGAADIAQYREGVWYVQATTTDFQADSFGKAGDESVVGDFDGDGRTDFAVYNQGVWSIRPARGGAVRIFRFGLPTDVLIK